MQHSSQILCWSLLSPFTPSDTLSCMTLGYARWATVYAYMCAHKKHTYSVSFFSLTKPTVLIESSSTIPFLYCSSLSCMNYGQALWAECFSLTAGPGLLKSGSIAVPVILQGCHRRRNRKSIKAPMNQHSWPALLGQCATLPAAPPFHCLSTSLNPMSGTE